jgi:diguanylate cyclase (GGDEF)-like protein
MTEDKVSTTETNVHSELMDLRFRFSERVWHGLALYSVVNFCTNLLRIHDLNVQKLNGPIAIGMSLLVLMVSLYPLRKRFSPKVYMHLPVIVGFLISSMGLLATGILGVGISLVVMMNVIVAMNMSRRTLYASFLVSYMLMTGTAVAFQLGLLKYPADPVSMVNSPSVWINAIFAVSVLGYLTFTGIADYRRALRDSVRTVATQRDEIAKQRDLIHHQATHDALTGLPTLRLARDRLHIACSQAARDKNKAAALFIDLDGFKAANDKFGHDAGDHVLKIVAKRLSESVRSNDTVARQGGDEFIVIINGADGIDDARTVADKLVKVIAEPVYYNDELVTIGCSIGIAVFPDHASSPEQLLKHADHAMYAVKRSGKNNYCVYAGVDQAA